MSMEIDIVPMLGAVRRDLVTRERDGQTVRVLLVSRVYPTTTADLWNAITDGERIGRWFMPVTGDLRLGGRYQLQGNAGGTVTRCEPEQALGLTWEFGGALSWVDVTLTPEEDGTRLLLEHSAPAVDVEHWTTFGPGAIGIGWDLGLMGLDLHITTGRANDPAEAMAWMGSENGKGTMRASGEAWCQADIHSGTEPAVAEARAARTLAAYTGESA